MVELFAITAAALFSLGGIHAESVASRPPWAEAGSASRTVIGSREPVVLGEVRSNADRAKLPNVLEYLRKDMKTEIATIDWRKLGIRGTYTVSASVTRLESTRVKGGQVASCVVSVTLQSGKHELLATVEGRARAEDGPNGALRAEREALTAAVRQSIAPLPEVLRKNP